MDNISKLNGEQNVRIGRLEQWRDDFCERFDKFVGNDFHHLNKKVNYIFVLVVVGILIPIMLEIIQN